MEVLNFTSSQAQKHKKTWH